MLHKWSILCRKSSTDSTTNTMSLFEILEKITISPNAVQSVPPTTDLPDEFMIHFDFELVSMISDVAGKNKNPFVKIEIFNAKNEKLGETESKIEVPAGAKNMRSRIIFDAIKIKGAGMYSFKVNLKENEKDIYKQVTDIPLEIEILKSENKKNK